jgi:hypothetical protein
MYRVHLPDTTQAVKIFQALWDTARRSGEMQYTITITISGTTNIIEFDQAVRGILLRAAELRPSEFDQAVLGILLRNIAHRPSETSRVLDDGQVVFTGVRCGTAEQAAPLETHWKRAVTNAVGDVITFRLRDNGTFKSRAVVDLTDDGWEAIPTGGTSLGTFPTAERAICAVNLHILDPLS